MGEEQEREKRDTQMKTETVRQTETEAMPNVSEMQKKKRPFCETINLESSHLRISIWASNNSPCHMLQLAS